MDFIFVAFMLRKWVRGSMDNMTITLEMDEYVNQLLDAYIQGLDTARAVLNGIPNNKEEMMEVFKAKLQDRHKVK